MLTRIDHVAIAGSRLKAGIDAFTRLGFAVHPGGAHPGRGTENAIAFFGEDYLELVSVSDAEAHRASPELAAFLARGGGLRSLVVQSDDLSADVRAMRGRGVDVSDATAGGRRTPAGLELSWRTARLGPANPLPIVFIQHLTPLDARRRAAPGAGEHANGVLRTERAYV
ncbi:MAG: VOC family protein, partial [Candidatus Rokuibacteriota bacterium]